ncbi:MAG: roadblock/LC7 domain-containing protein [Acidobacteriota bacterium]
MFVERLQQVADRIEGAEALALVAKDGIPVESVHMTGAHDIELLAAELMSQVRAMSQNHEELDVGAVRHLTVTTERALLVISALTTDYYLMLAANAATSIGRARYELRRALLSFEHDLA